MAAFLIEPLSLRSKFGLHLLLFPEACPFFTNSLLLFCFFIK